MKKLSILIILLVAINVSAQEAYFTSYNFIVEPSQQNTVVKLISDYFTANKTEGVTVSLWENHFNDPGNNFTHMIVFSGSLDAMGNQYSNDGGAEWMLFMTQINQHIKDGFSSSMGRRLASWGDMEASYPVQNYYIVQVENSNTFRSAYEKYQSSAVRKGWMNMYGTFTTGVGPDGGSHWIITGHKDFKSAMGGSSAVLTESEKKTRDKAWNTFRETNGGAELVRSGTRVMLGIW
ncbi:MAG: hypothetical protein KJO93_02820 [Muriicola sp.]|nr:hypothetical protein [Muriicola sp.]NNK20743.1 hypothetical protein [Flavobacteriaceae bacterium]NNK34930.1 hypothetical protein [Eudoraea sp.]